VTASELLAFLDTVFAVSSAVCLVRGYKAIKARAIERHRAFMLAAFGFSAAFLVLFVIRFVTYGFRYGGTGVARGIYYGLLFAHEPIAVLSVPLACVTLAMGLRRAAAHAEIARPTLVLWLISCGTGAILFLFIHLL
jgi:putative membrane protein